MNTKRYSTNFFVTMTAASALLLTLGLQREGLAQENGSAIKGRIGIYDSRAVAIAFAGSPEHQKELGQLKAKYQRAKEAGDTQACARLQAEGKAWQVTMHKQGFSTAPVDDILAHITNALPEIQKSAGVSALVSKWDDAALKQHPGAETVDVTLKLVDAFHPSERQRNSAIEIQKHKPISLEQAEQIKD